MSRIHENDMLEQKSKAAANSPYDKEEESTASLQPPPIKESINSGFRTKENEEESIPEKKVLQFKRHSPFQLKNTTTQFQQAQSSPPTSLRHVIGSVNYYRLRYNDFRRRNPNLPAPDYYLGYGDKYINRFTNETGPTLTADGQAWLDRALVNLQLAIEDELDRNPNIELDNDAFRRFAFESHVDAYERAGVLELGVLNKVKILLTPDPADLFSQDGIAQALQIAQDQINYYLQHPLFAAQQIAELRLHKNAIILLFTEYIAEHSGYFGRNYTTPSDLIRRVLGPIANYIL